MSTQVDGATPAAATPRKGIRGAATVFSDYLSMFGARVGSVGLSLVSVMVTTRLLDPTGYAALAFFGVVSLLIFSVTSAWTSTAVAKFGREALERRGTIAPVTWARVALTAPLAAVACAAVVALKLAGTFPSEFSWTLTWLSLVYGIVWIAQEHVIYVTEAAGRMKRSAVGVLLQQAFVVAGVTVAYLANLARTPVAIAGLLTVSAAAIVVSFGVPIARLALWPPALDRALMRRILMFSVPMVAFTISQYVVKSVDLVMIRSFGTAHDAGVYAIAYQGYSVLQAVAVAAPQILTPLFVSLDLGGRTAVIERYLDRIVPQLTFVAAVITGIAAPFVAIAVPVVFGHKFAAAARPLEVLLISVALFFAANLLAPIVVLRERTKAIGAINVVAAVANVVGDVILLGPLHTGIVGPAIATGVSVAIVFVGYFLVSRNALRIESAPSPLLLLPLGLGVAAALALSSSMAIVVGVPLVVASAAAIQMLLQPFAREDMELVAALDMPVGVKTRALRLVAAVSR